MRVLLYVVSVFFLFMAAAGLAHLAMAPSPEGIVILAIGVGLGVYVFSLAGQYKQKPRRVVRTFLHLLAVTLLLYGLALMAGAVFLSFGHDVGALVWGVVLGAVGAFVLVKARRYKAETAQSESG